MKKLMTIIAAFVAIIQFSACNTGDTAATTDAKNLSDYVDSVNNLKPVYTETQWKMIDDGYQVRVVKVDKNMADLDASAKAKVEEDKKKYAALKTNYETEIKKVNDPAMLADKARADIRATLIGAGHPGANNDWTFVTKDNIVSVYKNFVDNVRDHGDNYSDAEWVETRALWTALNDRKEAINKDISTIDKITIDHLRVAYLAVKSVNKPVSQLK